MGGAKSLKHSSPQTGQKLPGQILYVLVVTGQHANLSNPKFSFEKVEWHFNLLRSAQKLSPLYHA
jgi:hypothetical protein